MTNIFREDKNEARRFYSLDKKVHRLVLLLWMGISMFVFMLLFGPHEFWWILQKLGLGEVMTSIKFWLSGFFTAGYNG